MTMKKQKQLLPMHVIYWCDITGEVKESVETSNSRTVNYVSINSKAITMRQKKNEALKMMIFILLTKMVITCWTFSMKK